MHPGHPNDSRTQRVVPLFFTGNNFVLLNGRWNNPNFVTYIPNHYGVFPMNYYPAPPIQPPLGFLYRPPAPPQITAPFSPVNQQPNRFIHPATSLPPIPPPSRPPSTRSNASSMDYMTEEQMEEIEEEIKRKEAEKKAQAALWKKETEMYLDAEERGGKRRECPSDYEEEFPVVK